MTESITIHLGGDERELRFGIKAVVQAERYLDGQDLAAVTLQRLSLLHLCKIAAAGLSTYGDKGKKVTPNQIENWIDDEPSKLADLERAVIKAVSVHLVAVNKMSVEDARALGEALASAARASVASLASGPAGASGSTPTTT